MDGFEHGIVVADVHGREQAQAADETAGQVGQDVAIEVGRDDDIELFRTHDHLHARVVDDFVVAFDLRIILGDGVEDVEEQAVAHLEDIGLMDAGNLFASMGYGVVESGLNDAFTGLAGDELDGVDRVFIHLVFDADVQVFRVFPESDDVDVGEGRLDGCVRFGRTDIGIEVVFVAQRDVERAEPLADRRGDWRFQQETGLFKRSKGVVRDEGAVAFIFGSADVENFIGKGSLGGVEDLQDSVGDFRADAVAFEYGNCLHDLSVLSGNIIHQVADVFRCRTDDTVIIQLVFDVVGQPADHTADDEERRVEVARDAQHIVGEAAVIIDVAAHVDAFFFFQGLHGQLFEAVVEAEDIGHAFFLGQDAAVVAHDFGARVRQGVDGVAEAVDQAIVTAFEFLIE